MSTASAVVVAKSKRLLVGGQVQVKFASELGVRRAMGSQRRSLGMLMRRIRRLLAHRSRAVDHRANGRRGQLVTAARMWTLEHRARPWTMNAERRMNPFERASLATSWRAAFHVLTRAAKIHHSKRRSSPSAGPVESAIVARCRCMFPAAKSAIDGIVDAGVLPDDDAEHLVELRFLAPALDDHDGLVLIIEVADSAGIEIS